MDMSVVPIGKYKGEPIERLLADQGYSEWLLAQAWFLERYAELAQILRTGRMAEPQDTPEHNAMIATLIDQRDSAEWLFAEIFRDWPALDWFDADFRQVVEPKGGDLELEMLRNTILIEAKPLIGDDYPSVIRQVKAGAAGQATPVVIAGKVETTNLTHSQIARQFYLAGVKLVLLDDFQKEGAAWARHRQTLVRAALPDMRQELEGMPENPGYEDEWKKNDLKKRIGRFEALADDPPPGRSQAMKENTP